MERVAWVAGNANVVERLVDELDGVEAAIREGRADATTAERLRVVSNALVALTVRPSERTEEFAARLLTAEGGDMPGDPCALSHTLVGPDMDTLTVSCEVCGYTEEADPDDVARQERILAEMDK